MPSGSDSAGRKGDRLLTRDATLAAFYDAIVSGLTVPLLVHPCSERSEELTRKILPLCRRAQITRLGELTGLDRIGLHVVQAVRPAALSEVTSLGRGFSLAEAAVGAMMESLERFYAESISPDRIILATADSLHIADGMFDSLLQTNCQAGWRGITIPWIAGVNLVTGAGQPIPLELIHTCYTNPPPSNDGLFVRTTTGLACHITAYAAFLHGLFECIERDAIARAFATHGFFDRMRIAASGLGNEVEQLLSVAGEHGISVGLWYAPSPTKVPVVWCQTIETGRGEPILALPTEGYSAGISMEAAASSAILEALATRTGAISGARDDQTRRHYKKSADAIVLKARRLILEEPSLRRMAAVEARPVSDLGSLIERVLAAGLGPVLAVPVGENVETSVRCVRAILPGAVPFSLVR